MRKLFIILIIILGNFCSIAQDSKEVVTGEVGSGVEIKYRKYEKFNLKDLVIDGKIIVPGDLSVKELGEVDLRRNLFEKPHFKNEQIRDLKNL